ncbi:MAG: DUF4091 domain-containing protein [Chitinophagaceae bacterium]|nr:DUF4091 domain-containing protein [Chitinophagaceae bacterium]
MRKAHLIVSLMIIAPGVLVSNIKAQQKKNLQHVKLTVLNSMERIGQDQALFGQPNAAIKAAKNEVESFQVVIHAAGRNIVIVKTEMSDLTGKAGTIKKENIALFREEFTRIRLSTPRATLPPGLYPDPLVPFIEPQTGKPIEPRNQSVGPDGAVITKGYDMYAQPFKVWAGQNQPLWVDIAVPKNASPGEYKGTLSLYIYNDTIIDIPQNDGVMFPVKSVVNDDKQSIYTVDVSLTAWDFTLPDGPTHRNNFGKVNRRAAAAFGLDQTSPEFREIELNYCKMLADNRINPPIPDWLLPEINEDGSLRVTDERTRLLKKFLQDLHVTDLPVPDALLNDTLTVNREKAIRYYKELYRYLKDNGLEKRAYLYMFDEPNNKESYEKVIALGKLIQEAAPQLRRLVVEQPYAQNPSWPDIDSAVDIWCPLFSFINRKAINEKLANGDEVWSYAALAQRAPDYSSDYNEVKNYDPPYWAIDQPLTSYRMPTWINMQYNITGLLYWTTVYSDKSVTGVMDPWFLPVFTAGGEHFSGEGYLLYPGKPCGINGPVASIRLKNIRDAMEDYEYFALLQQLAGREAVVKIIAAIVPNWWAKPTDKDFLTVREKIANEILKVKK